MILDFDDFDLLKLVTYWPIFSKFRGDPVKKNTLYKRLNQTGRHIIREHYHYFYNTKHSLVPAQCQKFQSGIVGIAGEPCAGSNTESVKIN